MSKSKKEQTSHSPALAIWRPPNLSILIRFVAPQRIVVDNGRGFAAGMRGGSAKPCGDA